MLGVQADVVDLLLREPQPGGSSVLLWMLVAGAAGTAVLAGLAARAIFRGWVARAPAEAAFVLIARRCRLTRRERTAVRALARAHGHAAPAAILLSVRARRVARGAAGDGVGGDTLASIERKIGG